MIQDNNLANVVNELLNGAMYKDNGSLFIGNGSIIIIPTTGTGLQVGGNSILGALTTMNTSLTTALATFASNAIVQGIANVNVANIAILTSNNANNLILDTTGAYSAVQGNLVINDLTVKGNQVIEGTTIISSNSFQERNGVPSDGDGAFQVWRGTTINANAAILFNNTANVWQTSANDAQSFVTLLTTSNLIDNFTSTSTTNAPTANAVNAVFAAAITNAAGVVANSGVYVTQRKGIDFINGVNLSLNVAANVANANLTDVTLSTNTSLTVNAIFSQYSDTGTIAGNVNVNCSLGSFFDFKLANNANVYFNNCAAAGLTQTIQILIRQSANGGNTLTWVNNVYWSDNTIPILSTGANVADMLQFTTFTGGTMWLGAMIYANIGGMNVANTFG